MPLDEQVVPIPLAQGVDTKTDPKQLNIGKLQALSNGIFTVGKELNKRNGFGALTQNVSTTGTVTSGLGVASYQNELTILGSNSVNSPSINGTDLFSYSDSSAKWVNKGNLANTKLDLTSVVKTTYQQTWQDGAINGALQCFTWKDSSSGGVNYSIIDTVTGQALVNNGILTASGNSTKSKVLALGTYFIVVYYDSGASILYYSAINTTTPTTVPTPVQLANDINTGTPNFDATIINGILYVAYNSSTATTVSVYSLTNALVLSTRQDTAGSSAATGITVFGDSSNNVWVVYGNTHFWAFISNAALNSYVLAATDLGAGATNMYRITGVYDAANSRSQIIWENATAATYSTVYTFKLTAAGAVSPSLNSQILNSFVFLASKCFIYNKGIYVWVNFTGSDGQQTSYFLLMVGANGDILLAAKCLPGTAGPGTPAPGEVGVSTRLPEVNVVSTGVYQTAFLQVDQISAFDGVISTRSGVTSAQLTFSQSAQPKYTIANTLHFTGAMPSIYDGRSVVEENFNVYPDLGFTTVPTLTAAGGAIGPGSSIAAVDVNQFQYVATYEWVDNQGQVQMSAPSEIASVVLPVSGVIYSSGTFTNASAQITAIASTAGMNQGTHLTGFGSGMNVINAIINTVSGATSVTTSIGFTGTTGTFPFVVTGGPILVFPATCSTTYGSKTVTTASTTGLRVGQTISESVATPAHFIAGTYITSITAGVSFTTSTASIYTASGVTFFTMDVNEVTIKVSPLSLTQKSNVQLAIWRTQLNQDIFYRITSPGLQTFNIPNNTTPIQIVDTISDNILIGNDQLYTTGGEVDNNGPPACVASTTFKSRGIIIPSESPYSWWYSKQVLPGVPLEYSEFFVENIDSRGGPITAVGALDEKLILFKAKNIFYVVGDGPSPSGANNDFSQAQLIASDFGCSNPASVLLIPMGLIFQSSKGIYLLDRGLNTQYIGADVEAYNSDTVTSAQIIPHSTMIKLSMLSGASLTYDWYYNQWSVDAHVTPAVDATIFSDKYTYIDSTGLVSEETPAVYTDNTAFIPLSLTTGWLNFGGIQGFQRVKELLIVGEYKSPHNLVVNFYSDFSSTANQTVTIPVLTNPGVYQFRVFINQQKCESLKISITDAQNGSAGQSYSISALSLNVGIKKGLDKVTAAQSFG